MHEKVKLNERRRNASQFAPAIVEYSTRALVVRILKALVVSSATDGLMRIVVVRGDVQSELMGSCTRASHISP